MGSLVAGVISAFIGGVLAAAAVFTVVQVSSGPTPTDVAQDRQVEVIDLAYGNR